MLARALRVSLCTLAVIGLCQTAEAQRPGQGQPRGPFGQGNFPQASLEASAIRLANIDAVKTEIKLDEEQSKKLQELATAQRDQGRGAFNREALQGLSEEERRARMEELRAQLTKAAEENAAKVKAILTPEQLQRLKEIAFQQRVQGGLGSAFSVPEFAEAAKVTDEQKEKLAALNQELRDEAAKQGEDRRAQFEWIRTEGNAKYAPKIEALLTADQKEVLTKMKGKEFDVSQLRQGFGPGQPGQPGQRNRGDRPQRPESNN